MTTRNLLAYAQRTRMLGNNAGGLPPQFSATARFKSTRPDPSSSSSSTSLLDSAADLFVSMRWKAANALTSSLSVEERTQLLERLDSTNSTAKSKTAAAAASAHKEEDSELKMKHTIAEAVAAARAQEAQRSQKKWEQEKEALMKEAEDAARARVESDLAIQKRRLQFEQWKEQVEKAKQADKQSEAVPTVATAEPVAAAAAADPKSEDIVNAHPTLGPCVLDLGYKRIHVVSTEALTAIPVWEKQVRGLNHRTRRANLFGLLFYCAYSQKSASTQITIHSESTVTAEPRKWPTTRSKHLI